MMYAATVDCECKIRVIQGRKKMARACCVYDGHAYLSYVGYFALCFCMCHVPCVMCYALELVHCSFSAQCCMRHHPPVILIAELRLMPL